MVKISIITNNTRAMLPFVNLRALHCRVHPSKVAHTQVNRAMRATAIPIVNTVQEVYIYNNYIHVYLTNTHSVVYVYYTTAYQLKCHVK